MTTLLPRRSALAASVLPILCLLSAAPSAGQNPLKWLTGDKGTKYNGFKDPAGRFEIEYPAKDWKLLPPGGSSLAVFARNDGPTLYIDHVRLREPLSQGEFDALPDVEISRLKLQEPNAKTFKSELLESRAGRGVLIRYSREGGAPETVMAYSIPVDQDMFRLSGIVADKQMAKYEPVVMHMIQSFQVGKTPSKPTP